MKKKEIEKQYGKILFDWDFGEYEKYYKTATWYIIAGAIGIALLVYSVWTTNFLFAVIILMFAIIILLNEFKNPKNIECSITDNGVMVGDRFYKYNEFNKFWILYKPPEVKNLYIEMKGIRPRLSLPLKNQDPNKLRTLLGKYLLEDVEQDEEPLTEVLGRILKI